MPRKTPTIATVLAAAAAAFIGMAIAQAPQPAPTGPAPAELQSSSTTPAGDELREAGLVVVDETQAAHVDPAAVSALLTTIPTTAPAPKADYDREAQFGQPWADVDRNGCDTRNDILKRDLTEPAFKPDTDDCKVIGGVLEDVYTGTAIPFQPGQAIQIEHLWPLSLAWHSGAASWTSERRTAFANDPTNLQAVDGPTNQAKGDKGPGEWLPPAADYHCEYVTRFVFIAHEYELAIAASDRGAIETVLSRCTG